MTDHDTLTKLNNDYIDSVQNGDVKRFEELLSDDYYCSNPDGSLVDRKGFLAQTGKPVTIKGLKGENVMIRMFGDIAIIHGATSFTAADGRAAHGRYTDIWRKENGSWRAIAAHVTRG
jgi:ketosteroid isomerase-like protein